MTFAVDGGDMCVGGDDDDVEHTVSIHVMGEGFGMNTTVGEKNRPTRQRVST